MKSAFLLSIAAVVLGIGVATAQAPGQVEPASPYQPASGVQEQSAPKDVAPNLLRPTDDTGCECRPPRLGKRLRAVRPHALWAARNVLGQRRLPAVVDQGQPRPAARHRRAGRVGRRHRPRHDGPVRRLQP